MKLDEDLDCVEIELEEREEISGRAPHIHSALKAACAYAALLKLAPEIGVLDDLHDLVSVETQNELGLWSKTHLECASTGDPIYILELTKSDLVKYRKAVNKISATLKAIHDNLTKWGE